MRGEGDEELDGAAADRVGSRSERPPPHRVRAERREVDHENLLADHRGERVRKHRLAGARRAVEEEDHAAAVGEPLV